MGDNYVNSETGSANTSFLGNKRIINCTAAGIKDALCEYLKEKSLVQGDDYIRIVGLETDGAAVVTGCPNGLGVKLKQLNNILIQVQYRPRALQHYMRVSCVEICHIARKFHKKNSHVKKYTRKYTQIRKIGV